jgi:streptogramin lyase
MLLLGALVLSGCSGMPVTTSTHTGPAPGVAISGKVHGGQNPIAGAHVYLYAVNDTGYAGPGITATNTNAAVSLLAAPGYVTTAPDGTFSISGDYTCPTATPDVYLLAVGGSPNGSGNNSAISLAAGLGSKCTSSSFSSIYVVINEVSTIAAAYGGAGFATDATHVSTSGTPLAVLGVEDAYYGPIVNLETVGTGVANTVSYGGNGTVPQAEVNTLANILAACVNSSGSGSSACTTLFDNALSGGTTGTEPTDTTTAALNIAHNPSANVANLYALQTGSAPFQPDLSSAPNDFTIAISYTATPALNSPAGLAIDGKGDVIVANNGGNSLTAFSPVGSYLTTVTTGGLNAPWGIAIDGSGNLWVSNNGNNTISEFNSSGVANTSSPFSGGGLTKPEGLAVDAQSHLWVANPSTNVLSEFNVTDGSAVSSSGITTGGLNSPDAVAVDDNGEIWVANSGGSGSLSLYTALGAVASGSPFSDGGLSDPQGVAIDSNNSAWVANSGANVVSEFASTGVLSTSGYSGGGLDGANSVAVDATDRKWIANRTGNSITELAANGSAISPTTGYLGGLHAPVSIAVDPSGNVWVSNSGNNTITEFLGIATPLVTPIAGNLIPPYGDSAVNLP